MHWLTLSDITYQVSMFQFCLPIFIKHNLSFLISNYRVLYNAIMSWWDCYHLFWSIYNFLIVLSNIGLWANFYSGDVGVLVQYMNVVVRRYPKNTHLFTSACVNPSTSAGHICLLFRDLKPHEYTFYVMLTKYANIKQ